MYIHVVFKSSVKKDSCIFSSDTTHKKLLLVKKKVLLAIKFVNLIECFGRSFLQTNMHIVKILKRWPTDMKRVEDGGGGVYMVVEMV